MRFNTWLGLESKSYLIVRVTENYLDEFTTCTLLFRFLSGPEVSVTHYVTWVVADDGPEETSNATGSLNVGAAFPDEP